jgi:hypothetical protein
LPAPPTAQPPDVLQFAAEYLRRRLEQEERQQGRAEVQGREEQEREEGVAGEASCC